MSEVEVRKSHNNFCHITSNMKCLLHKGRISVFYFLIDSFEREEGQEMFKVNATSQEVDGEDSQEWSSQIYPLLFLASSPFCVGFKVFIKIFTEILFVNKMTARFL